MTRDYRLHELNDNEFERLVVRICSNWLGVGVTPFASGRDGGRDGKFHGTANRFPSEREPVCGHFVLQAKHVSAPNKSCSDSDFARVMKAEHPKIAKLVKAAVCDHYIVFTNRKLTAESERKLVAAIHALGVATAHVVGVERLNMALDQHPDIRATLPNRDDTIPFRFNPDDLVDVIGALHDYVAGDFESGFDSAHDFDSVHIKNVKNKINGLSAAYYDEIIVADSMPHFQAVEKFIRNRRNSHLANLYHDTANELKAKILLKRSEFPSFDDVFAFVYEQVQSQSDRLKGKRRMISVIMHYMYCQCDIGSRRATELLEASGVEA